MRVQGPMHPVAPTRRRATRRLPSSRLHPSCRYNTRSSSNNVALNKRLVGAARGSERPIAPYDAELLARARSYAAVPIEGALWSLRLAADAWGKAVAIAGEQGVMLAHPDRGPKTVSDIVRNNAHDAHHHAWDVERIGRADDG